MAASVSRASASSDSTAGAVAAGPTSMGAGPSAGAAAARGLSLPSSAGDCAANRAGACTAAVCWPPSTGEAGDIVPLTGGPAERPLGSA